MLCDFKTVIVEDVHVHTCQQCGCVRRSFGPRYVKECKGGGKIVCPPPSTLQKATRYALSTAAWAAAGFPIRPPEEQQRIIASVCEPCEYFQNGSCVKCGCVLREKIKRATESCPVDKW